jgi:hypothetical protein
MSCPSMPKTWPKLCRSRPSWTPNRKVSSSTSSNATWTYLHGAQQKCWVYPRKSSSTPLNIKPGSKLIKQGMRLFNQEKRQAMGEELSRLLATDFVKEVQHPDWIANPILVPKKSRKWQMCVDYTSLNKACPNDAFPLPCIDQVVDLTARCELLSFLDAYSSYHQIPLAKED